MTFERRILTRYEADSRGFDRGTRRVNQKLTRLERNAAGRLQSIDRRFEKAARGAARLGAAIAAFASIQGLRRLQRGIEGAVTQLDNVAKTADKLGLTTTALQELRVAAELSGVSVQTFDMAFQRFTRRAGEAAQGTGEAKDALKTLGVTLSDLQTRSPEQLFNQVADAIAKVEDPAQRLRLAFKLFDSEGAALVNALTGGSEGLDRMRERARELGVVIDEDLIRRSVEAKDELTLLGKVIDANVTTALANLGPLMVNLSQFFADLSAVLPNSAEEMEVFATALQTTAVAAAAVAGGRGIRAVNAALIESAAARRDEVAASKAAVAAAQQEVRARRSALTTLQLQTVKQAQSAAGIKNAEAANKRLVTARRALTTAETQAAAATDRLTAAQARLSAATRITTGAMTALRRAFAFLGGVPGILLGVASAAFLLSDAFQSQADRIADIEGRLGELGTALNRVSELERQLESDTDALTAANGRLETAIAAQSDAAESTARIEIDAINQRIAKNRELLGEYKELIRAQIDVIRGDIAIEQQRLGEIAGRVPTRVQTGRPGEGGPLGIAQSRALSQEEIAQRQLRQQDRILESIRRKQEAGVSLSETENEFLQRRLRLLESEATLREREEAFGRLGQTPPSDTTFTPSGEGAGGGGGARASATKEETDALQELIDAADKRAFQLLDEIQITRAAADEVTFLTEKQRLLNEAQDKGLAITPELMATIDGLARSYADISEELDKVTAARELVDQAAERELTTTEKITRANERLTALLPQLIDLTGDQAEAERILADAKRDVAEKIREAEEDPSIKRLADDIGTAITQAESLSDALETVLKKLAEIALQAAFQSALSGGNAPTGSNPFAGLFNSIFSGVFHKGGVAGQTAVPQRQVPAATFLGAPRMHSGGIAGLRPNEVPAILERGEIVVPKNLGVGRASSVVVGDTHLHVNQPGATAEQLQRLLAEHRREILRDITERNERDPDWLHT